MGMSFATRIELRVHAGVQFLDETEPGWDRRIDSDRLDMSSHCDCIGGQLHDTFGEALQVWFGGDVNPAMNYGMARMYLADPGASLVEIRTGVLSEYSALTAEWRRRIEERRAADGEQVDVVVLG